MQTVNKLNILGKTAVDKSSHFHSHFDYLMKNLGSCNTVSPSQNPSEISYKAKQNVDKYVTKNLSLAQSHKILTKVKPNLASTNFKLEANHSGCLLGKNTKTKGCPLTKNSKNHNASLKKATRPEI